MPTRCTIQGTHGELVVDRKTGDIISRTPREDGQAAYAEISRFDPDTLTGEGLDILECGYFEASGAYVPPDADFLAHVASLSTHDGRV